MNLYRVLLPMMVFLPSFAFADIACPPMPTAATAVNHDVKSHVEAAVGSLGKLKAADLSVQTEVQAKNLMKDLPNLDRVVITEIMAATYCGMLRDNKAVTEKDKLDRWEKFQKEILSFMLGNRQSNPGEQKGSPLGTQVPQSRGGPLNDRTPGPSSQSTPPPTTRSSAGSSGNSGAALARLVDLGWTVKPSQRNTQFEVASKALPPMKESAIYFSHLGQPYNLHFQQVTGIEGLHYLANDPNCTKIAINAGAFSDLSELHGFIHLTDLEITQLPFNDSATVDLSPLASMTGLKQLNLDMVRTKSIVALANLKKLRSLNVGQTLISDISSLSGLGLLESLDIRSTRVTDLRPLTPDQNLRELSIGGAQIPGLQSLVNLSNLKKISLIEQQSFDLTGVGALTGLESLWIWDGSPSLDAYPLHDLLNLRALTIAGMDLRISAAVTNIEMIGDLKKLRTLTLDYLLITDLSFLGTLQNLTEINLTRLPVSSIAKLGELKALKKVSLVDIPVVDISPLLSLTDLTELTVGRTPARSDVLEELRRRGVTVTSY